MQPPEFIETGRLSLRQAVQADAETIFESYAQDIEVARYMTWKPHDSVEDTREFLRRCEQVWASGMTFPWAICLKSSGDLIGMIEVGINGQSAAMGYGIARPHWGHGYTTEAARAVIDWCLSQPPIYRVWAICDVDNPASARVMAKAGMEYEGVLKKFCVHPNISPIPRDVLCYAIVKE